MRQAIIHLRAQRALGQHPGLLLARYLTEQSDDGSDRRELFEAACAAGRNPSLIALYRRAYDRWHQSLTGVKAANLRTPPHTRLIVGLGNKGVIEAGLRLHHTYGVPLIPASALKGLSSHYCHEVYGMVDEGYRRSKEYHNLLFGQTEDGGVIRFEDAWMHPESLSLNDHGLLADVMTPHHQKWQTDEPVAPTDFDSPVPVPFLSVAGHFHVAVCWQGPEHAQAEAWTERALELLLAALVAWGVGGKTSSGYGRLTVVDADSRRKALAAKALGLPAVGTVVTATLLETPKRNKPWRAKLTLRTGKDLAGPIEPLEQTPADAAPGKVVPLVVSYVDEKSIRFTWSK